MTFLNGDILVTWQATVRKTIGTFLLARVDSVAALLLDGPTAKKTPWVRGLLMSAYPRASMNDMSQPFPTLSWRLSHNLCVYIIL